MQVTNYFVHGRRYFVCGGTRYVRAFLPYRYFIINSRTQQINFMYYGTVLWHTCPSYLLICFETHYYQMEWVTIRCDEVLTENKEEVRLHNIKQYPH